MNNKKKVLLYFAIAIFGIIGIYLTFFTSNTNKYDSQTSAYRIYTEESYNSDDEIMYQPIYFFRVKDNEYECRSKTSSNIDNNGKKKIVYYDSKDPTKCLTEYDRKTSKTGGIIFLIVTALIIYFGIIRKPTNVEEENNTLTEEINNNNSLDQEKMMEVVGKVNLISKRIVLGIIIIILLVLILIDSILLKQTIESRNYIETIATYVNKIEDGDSEIFADYIYTFTDKKGKQQEIILSFPIDDQVKQEIKIKYNENNPKKHYDEAALLSKSRIIWFIVKVVALVLLIILFSNKSALSRINISSS